MPKEKEHVSIETGKRAILDNAQFVNAHENPETWNQHVAIHAILCALEDQADRLKAIEEQIRAT